ncbi:EAL domain-containing protein [Agrobacterium larrymoorei]|uniref:putative bifunctional diguanylate cyclase/phosphodiesterase n=1 Tax=Agrobacterium larrymoorei TaxID=160699 RepID=UPI001573424E|nr:EAL domain-containing protein [Agrobacterium larrymoorei]NTJ42951.1 EAL domain-containing protein [Agrobacterium larrymoorei]
MTRLWNCIVFEHDIRYVLAACIICASGSFLTINLFARARQPNLLQRLNWLCLASVMCGATMWATHFVTMLGYRIEGVAGFDPNLTAFSFIVAVCAALAGFAISIYGGRGLLVEAGGAVIGIGVASTHYVGMAAYSVQGRLVWDHTYIIISIMVSMCLGILAVNRVFRSTSRYGCYGGATLLFLAVVINHNIGMAAMSLEFDPAAQLQESFLSPAVVASGAILIIVALMSSCLATYRIDMQSTRQALERYRYLSLHDPLTGIANRVGFKEHLVGAIDRAGSTVAGVALLSFDLNRFKEINDVYGHAAGDAVLGTIARRISAVLGVREFVARIGGDEFVAVKECYYSRNDSLEFARRLQKEVTSPIEWEGQTLTVGASFGISELSAETKSVDALISQADVAMYRAKAGVAGTICFYDKRMDEMELERNALATDMRAGLQRNEFELYYQHQNLTDTGVTVSFEVLLRWNHPQRGMVSPVQFIPIAEKTGFIVPLGEWVLRHACREAVRWKAPYGIAVNVAAQQLADRSFTTKVERILAETGLDPRRLEIEITESSIIADHEHALMTIRGLKSMGLRIAMDDYGKGHSSLSTLQSFPFDKIKLDRSFVTGLPSSVQSDAIVRSTLILANSLDIVVLAEGVETQEQLDFLRREGCHYVQGFYFGRPGPVENIFPLVNEVDVQPQLDISPLKAAS